MRESKFRGRRKNSSEWVYGAFLAIPKLCSYIYDVQPDGQATRYLVDEDTVGQFTGLKDSTGKEIYEGDIVEISPQFSAKQGLKRKFHLSAVVRWDERFARFVVISKEILDTIPNSECVTVIGNIHDNPELLEAHA